MKKVIFIILVLLLFPLNALAKVKVVTTLPIFASLANAVGGERISTKSLARANQDPHFLPAKPAYAVALNRANLLIHAGMDLEVGWLPAVLIQSRNPKIQFNAVGNVNASEGITALEVPSGVITRAMGDVHPLGNPHYYLDPRNGSIIAENIFKHLVEVDPGGESYYQGRLAAFQNKLKQQVQNWESRAAPLKGKPILTFHKTWTYLVNWLGLNVVGNVEPKPGIPPNAKHTDWLIKMIPQNQVRALLMTDYYPRKVPDYISQKTGIPLLVLGSETLSDSEQAFFDLFESILSPLMEKVP